MTVTDLALQAQGVVFCDMATAVLEYPELVDQYLGTIVSPDETPPELRDSSAWSAGSFVYVPPGVHLELPLQRERRSDEAVAGPLARTLLIAEEGSQVHYVDGCSAPVYSSESVHRSVVEVVVKPSARVVYTSIQNWSDNVRNLVAKCARVEAGGRMEWVEGNIGSMHTTAHPAIVLAGAKASAEVHSLAYAGRGQHQAVGATMIHAAPETTSKVVAKSISTGGGRASYRGLVRVERDADGCTSEVHCDALLLDEDSMFESHPATEIDAGDAAIEYDATVTRIVDEHRFYLQSRGLSEEQATGMIVSGFVDAVTSAFPVEYAVECSRLIEMRLQGSVG